MASAILVPENREQARHGGAFTKLEDATYSVLREKKSNHQANIVRINDVLVHPNADKLELINVNGYQLVSQKGQFKVGDLAVFIQPDSIVPQTAPFEFIWKDHVGIDGVVPEKRRRITVRRFRKEWSEGLLLPTSDFKEELQHIDWNDGTDVADVIGVTHYVPEFDLADTTGSSVVAPRRRYPKTLRGWFYFLLHKIGVRSAHAQLALDVNIPAPHYDVDSLKSVGSRRGFDYLEIVTATEKIHGSNARYVFVDGVLYAGSHFQWKAPGAGVWWEAVKQNPEIEEWCTQNPGKVLYGEVGPTQKGFRYGADEGQVWFYAFDVYDPETNQWSWPGNEGFGLLVPILAHGPYGATMNLLADGLSVVPGAGKQIREGVVISSTQRRLKLKVVSNNFLEKDNS